LLDLSYWFSHLYSNIATRDFTDKREVSISFIVWGLNYNIVYYSARPKTFGFY